MFGRTVSWILVVGIIVLCVVAIDICNYLMGIHSPVKSQAQQIEQKHDFWASACGEDEEGGANRCAEVVTSEFGYVSIPWLRQTVHEAEDEEENADKEVSSEWISYKIPVAQAAVCYYIFLAVWFLFTGRPSIASRWWHLLPMILSAVAVGGSLYYIYIMASKLDQWCRACMWLHMIDFAIFPCVIFLWPLKNKRKPANTQQDKEGTQKTNPSRPGIRFPHAVATMACALAVCAMIFIHQYGLLLMEGQSRKVKAYEGQFVRLQKDEEVYLGTYLSMRQYSIPHRADEAIRGNPNSENEIVLLSDLQCPACRRFENRFQKEFQKYFDGDYKLIFRHFPLDKSCNPTRANLHPMACQAAYAAEAARLQGGPEAFWKMHDLLMANQRNMRNPKFAEIGFPKLAEKLGLDVEKFMRDVSGPEVRQRVAEDVQLGHQLGVTGTPTVFINGKKLASYALQTNNENFWRDLPKLLERMSQQTPSTPAP